MIRLDSPSLKQAPGPWLEQFRAEGALGDVRAPLIGRFRITTTHAGADELLKDRSRFVSNPATAGIDASVMPRWLPKRFHLLAKNIVLYDEPDHRRLRSRIDHAFARRGVAGMRQSLEQQTDALLDALEPSGFDIVSGLARPLPLAAISELLGLPPGERDLFERLAAPLSGGGGSLSLLLGVWRLGGLLDELRARIEAARAGDDSKVDPGGLLAALATQSDEDGEGGALDEDELLAMVLTLLVAGHETTTHLIAGGAWALLSHPEELQKLRSGAVSIEDAVEELMRWLTPVMVTKPRFAAEHTTIEGAPIERGQRVIACLIAANHDPARWEDPERLDLSRRPSGHLGFGAGIHFCVGLNLARLEARIVLARLLERFPTLRLDGEPKWSKRFGLRGMTRLRLRAD